ncbi:hypothetical protein [Thalassovita sp.]|uniref:hypothetical protein n=1 Tax=Thalassovita sp. TaxID=1979401 RepID=UPI002881B729|nr:hypothetical protein [Thalassovita sp.]MDF1803196.1 hypothetical protein [Thalassovita sp.]
MTQGIDHKPWAPRILRGAAIGGLGIIAISCAGLMVLWDADFYAVREKYEHLKLAFYGEWQAQNWCPPGRDTENCRAVDEFTAALEGAENFNFFRSLPVEGTSLTVITGVAFASALDVVAGAPSNLWCYINDGQGAVSRRITLANMRASQAPSYTDFSALSGDEAQGLPLSAERLSGLAQSHCQFNDFNLT